MLSQKPFRRSWKSSGNETGGDFCADVQKHPKSWHTVPRFNSKILGQRLCMDFVSCNSHVIVMLLCTAMYTPSVIYSWFDYSGQDFKVFTLVSGSVYQLPHVIPTAVLYPMSDPQLHTCLAHSMFASHHNLVAAILHMQWAGQLAMHRLPHWPQC